MSYYNPNFYQNFPQYYAQPQQAQGQYIPQVPQPSGLNGKIVDSEEVVKATEVPIGGYGIFPKADLSEIYIKSWNSNGTISIMTYKPTQPIERDIPITSPGSASEILEQIKLLEAKIDNIIEGKKEKVNINDY